MPENVEIKARVTQPGPLRTRATEISDGPAELIVQRDVFFLSSTGRLKLRCFPDGSGELIHYERPDRSGPRTSRYTIFPVEHADGLVEMLTAALGKIGVVEKRRTLFLVGQTRVHLDEVVDLGDFMELEVVLEEGQTEAEGEVIARELMERLEVSEAELVAGAYIDLMLAAGG